MVAGRPEQGLGGRLDGKVALVTGSTRGIGRGIAERFGREGAAVVVTGRSAETGEEVVEAVAREGGRARFVATDLADESQVRDAVRATVDEFGALHVLVNNAAPTDLMGPGGSDRSVVDIADEAWESILRVGLTAVMWCCRHAVPVIRDSGGGAIVNISSAASLLGVAGLDAYTATKGAMNALTRSMAVELAPDIRVNTIAPGMVLTSPGAWEMMDDPVLGTATRALHLTRLGEPTDIANAALFLASDEAAFVTGVVMPVDGGATAKMAVPDISAHSLDG